MSALVFLVAIASQRPDVMSPLCRAAYSGDEAQLVRLSGQEGVNLDDSCQNHSALMWAAKMGHAEAVEALLRLGANVNLILDDGWTALRWAAAVGNQPATDALFGHSANPRLGEDSRYGNLLCLAAAGGNASVVKAVLAKGCDVNAASGMPNRRPLDIASLGGHAAVAETLLNAGASPNLTGLEGRTPLHLACAEGHGRVVELLLAHGADPLAKDCTGRSPLHYAVQLGHYLAAQASVWSLNTIRAWPAPDGHGLDPAHLAAVAGRLDVISLMPQQALMVLDRNGRLPIHWAARTGGWGPAVGIASLMGVSVHDVNVDNFGNTVQDYLDNGRPERWKAALGDGYHKAPASLEIVINHVADAPLLSLVEFPDPAPGIAQGVQFAIWRDGLMLFAGVPWRPGEALRLGQLPGGTVEMLLAEVASLVGQEHDQGVLAHGSKRLLIWSVGSASMMSYSLDPTHDTRWGIGTRNRAEGIRTVVQLCELCVPSLSVPVEGLNIRGYDINAPQNTPWLK